MLAFDTTQNITLLLRVLLSYNKFNATLCFTDMIGLYIPYE